MSDNAEITSAESNVQVQSSPKTPSKRKLTSVERALAESEELVRQLGGSTEGGRRTRSSARGTPVTPPAPPPKKARISTPRRSRKAKEEEEDANVEAETNELAATVETPVKPDEPEDITDSVAQQNDASTNDSAKVVIAEADAPAPAAQAKPEKMDVDNSEAATVEPESTTIVEESARVAAPVEEKSESVTKEEAAQPAVEEPQSLVEDVTPSHVEEVTAAPDVEVKSNEAPVQAAVEPIAEDITDGVAPPEANIPVAEEAPAPVAAVETPVVAVDIPAPAIDVPSVAEVPDAAVAAEPPQEKTAAAPVAKIAEATPSIVVQPESVSADQQVIEAINKNGDIVANIENTPVHVVENATTKLDIAAGNEAAIKPLETIPATNAAV